MNTRHSRMRAFALSGTLALLVLAPAGLLQAETQVKPGFNVFSAEQDMEIGRQSAAEAQRQLPIVKDGTTDRYVERIVRDLAAQAPGPKFPYQIQVVNASDINAFALPGGYMYVNRGLLTAVRTEGELAGVLAHEMAHVALRHGTHNASKAYMTQAGLGVLGGILGRGQTRTTQGILNVVGGLGLNALFLKYGRDAETEADVVGAQIMSRAGYDPMEMVNFFQLLQSHEGGNSASGVAQFLSDHPAPVNRAARVRQEAQLIGAVRRARSNSGELATVQADLRGMAAAPSMRQIAQGDYRQSTSNRRLPSSAGQVRVEQPSGRFTSYGQRDAFFRMDIPDNWRAYESDNGLGVTFAPDGGVVELDNGQQVIVYGAIVNHYDPFEGNGARSRRGSLEQATDDLVRQIQQSNSHLRVASRGRRESMAGQPAISMVLSGTSPVTGQEERVNVVTRQLEDGHVIYGLFITPGRDYNAFSGAFARMMQSLQVNDEVAHR